MSGRGPRLPVTSIFISYRRHDCAGHAGRLYDGLVARFGKAGVFMDIDAIEPGVDFGMRIDEAVGACSVLVVLIGDDWLEMRDERGQRRLDDPADLVRLEVATGLRRNGLRVIPVLVERAQMPPFERLPDDLKGLARRNALELSDARWHYDVDRLLDVVGSVVTPEPGPGAVAGGRGDDDASEPSPAVPRERAAGLAAKRLWAYAGAAAAVVAVAAVVLLVANGDDDGDSGDGGGGGGAPTQETIAPKPPATATDGPFATVTRPNSLTFSGRNVVVLGPHVGELAFVDAATGTERKPRVAVGTGASAVAYGFGSLWVTKLRTGSLLRINPRTRQRVGAAIRMPPPSRPITVATDADAVWVAANRPGDTDAVIRVTPRRARPAVRTLPVAGSIQDLAVGAGAVWVSTADGHVVRIDADDASQRSIPVGRRPRGVTVGAGAVWVANAGDNSLTRIGAKTLATRTVPLPYKPERVAVGGGSVWVTAQEAGRLLRLDLRRLRVRSDPRIGLEPYALAVHRRRDLWLTLAGDDEIQRVPLTG